MIEHENFQNWCKTFQSIFNYEKCKFMHLKLFSKVPECFSINFKANWNPSIIKFLKEMSKLLQNCS